MKFGVRECVDVVFRAKTRQVLGNKTFYKNDPVLSFDSLKTSTLEGAATTVYATGGRGNSRLIAWEGERTMTFTMEDALISPESFAILSGANLVEASATESIQVHTVSQVAVETGKIITLPKTPSKISGSDMYLMKVNIEIDELSDPHHIDFSQITDNKVDLTPCKDIEVGDIVLVDYYIDQTSATQIEITADKFGGYYYIEGSTLFRREADGVDMPAKLIIPNGKVQSNFSFTMASSGDPSTFTFTVDAFPGYAKFNKSKEVLCALQIVNTNNGEEEERKVCSLDKADKYLFFEDLGLGVTYGDNWTWKDYVNSEYNKISDDNSVILQLATMYDPGMGKYVEVVVNSEGQALIQDPVILIFSGFGGISYASDLISNWKGYESDTEFVDLKYDFSVCGETITYDMLAPRSEWLKENGFSADANGNVAQFGITLATDGHPENIIYFPKYDYDVSSFNGYQYTIDTSNMDFNNYSLQIDTKHGFMNPPFEEYIKDGIFTIEGLSGIYTWADFAYSPYNPTDTMNYEDEDTGENITTSFEAISPPPDDYVEEVQIMGWWWPNQKYPMAICYPGYGGYSIDEDWFRFGIVKPNDPIIPGIKYEYKVYD